MSFRFGAERSSMSRVWSREALDMGVDDDALGRAERDAEDDVGRLAADARERGELGQGAGHGAPVAREEVPGEADDVLRLLVVHAEAPRPEELGDVGRVGGG